MRGFTARFEPPRTGEAPVLLALHGTGGDEHSVLPLARVLAADAGVLAPRGPVREADGSHRFFTRVPTGEEGPYRFTFDDDDVLTRGDELARAAADRLAEEGVADRPVVAVGFSNGANLATALPLVAPALLRGVIAFAPMPVLTNPPTADLGELAAWLATGREDPIATPAGLDVVAAMLSDRGAAVTLAHHDGGHTVTGEAITAAAGWLARLRSVVGDATKPLP